MSYKPKPVTAQQTNENRFFAAFYLVLFIILIIVEIFA